MTLDELIAEMHRKPDAEILIEWIEQYVEVYPDDDLSDVGDAIDAYRKGCDR